MEKEPSREGASRREFLRAAAALPVSCYLSAGVLGCGTADTHATSDAAAAGARQDALDEALDRFARTGPEYGGGLANHGPMAAEALATLGRVDAVGPWVDGYARRLGPRLEGRAPIAGDAWREALGDFSRAGDWAAFFEREVKDRGWRSTVREWVPRLAPGLIASATHGLIRTGHATRALAARETPARRRELAEGLAYWAARYRVLPGTASAAGARLSPSEAVSRVELLPQERRQSGRGIIADRLRELDTFPPFAGAVSLVDVSGDPSRFVSDLTGTMARVYLANAGAGSVIALVHGVTGPSALRLLLPHLAPESAPDVLRYAWQAAAAVYAVYARTPGATPAPTASIARDELVERAVRTGDEHAIKFSEACLREYAVDPKPVFLLAAADGVGRLG